MIMNDFSRLPQDIIFTHILPHIDGETLISLSSVSSEFRQLICKNKNNNKLWWNICTSTWPSLRSDPILFYTMISNFPGGFGSFFSDAFPSIYHRNNYPPRLPSPLAYVTYAIDIFLQGSEQEPLFAKIQRELVNMCIVEHSLLHWVNSKLDFIRVKKDSCEEYLKKNLRLSCLLILYHGYFPSRNRAGSLFSSNCESVVSFTTDRRWVTAVYKTVLPGLCKDYTEMVKCEVKVTCGWKDGVEDKFYVKYIDIGMEDLNGKHLKQDDAAIVLFNAIENGERRRNKSQLGLMLVMEEEINLKLT